MKMKKCLAAQLLLAAFLAVPAAAGDGNSVWLTQISPPSSLNGNALTVDQSSASESTLMGVLPAELHYQAALLLSGLDINPGPALQQGEGNVADLTFSGRGGTLQLLQSSPDGLPGLSGSTIGYNRATAVIGAGDLGVLVQVGSYNVANMLLEGDGATGLITQLGSNLDASLQVGSGGLGQITQIGNNSDAGHLVVHAGTLASVVQIGDNLRPVTDQAFEIMSTNPGTVTIKQTGW